MSEELRALARCPLFEGVSEAETASMLACMGARIVTVARGDPVFLAGQPAECVGVVLEGEARVQRDDYNGNRAIQAVLRPGDMFGEVFACAGVRRLPVTVEAVMPGRVLLIRLRAMLQTCPSACAHHSRLVGNLLRAVAEKNLQLNDKLEILAHRTIREKLLAYLYGQARRQGSAEFLIPLDRQGLADYLGVDRSALSSEIGKLRREGLLESERSAFRLLNMKEQDD